MNSAAAPRRRFAQLKRLSRLSRVAFAALLLCLVSCGTPDPSARFSPEGPWHAWLESPGGELPFGLELDQTADGWNATVLNGPESLDVPDVEWNSPNLTIRIPHYDSQIEAAWDGESFHGEWSKTAGPEETSRLKFHATPGSQARFTPEEPADTLAGRWAVDFETDDEVAVAIFESDGTRVLGTFMTATGDYRYLEGRFADGRLRLSVFDGAHAFLFDAKLQDDGTLAGDFWSRDSWHETWTATRDADVQLPDAFQQTSWDDSIPLSEIRYPDVSGVVRSLDDPEFAGSARLVVVFGTWCPNCNDCSEFLVELDRTYGERGLSIVGLAFEMTGDFERDAAQVKTYLEYHSIEYPILVAGLSDKALASEAFPLIDQVRSYPTTLFIDAAGNVQAVHTGFTGPATGPDYDQLRTRFIDIIEGMLADSAQAENRSDTTRSPA